MKKRIIGAVIAVALSAGAFAKTWTNNVGVGLTVPVSIMHGKDAIFFDSYDSSTQTSKTTKDKTAVSYNVLGSYLGYHENGFTVKGALSLGIAAIPEWFYDDGATPGIGVSLTETIGAGYSFIRSDRFVLAATGGFGLQEIIIPHSHKNALVELDITDTLITFNLGADITAILKTSDTFGFFASCYLGWIPFGQYKQEVKRTVNSSSTTITNTVDLDGSFFIAPSIGLQWVF